jgi:hypothetical protein
VAAFVEEVLRFDSPVQLATNRVGRAVEVGGLAVEPADNLMPNRCRAGPAGGRGRIPAAAGAVPGAGAGEPTRRADLVLRGLDTLPVLVG